MNVQYFATVLFLASAVVPWEQTLARSKFSGNYTLIRDLYSEGGANFTAIIPRDLSYGLVPSNMTMFNEFWGSFLWNGTGIGTGSGQVPLGAAMYAITDSPKSESIVLYHILRGTWQPQELLAAGSVNSLLGELLNQSLPLTFYTSSTDNSTLMVNGLYGSAGAMSTPPDQACNGLLYTTVAMLAPAPNMTAMPEISTEVDVDDIVNAQALLAEGFNFSSKNPSQWTSASILESLEQAPPNDLLPIVEPGAPAPAPAPSATYSPPTEIIEDTGISVGEVVGITVGVAAAVAIAVIITLLLLRRRRKHIKATDGPSSKGLTDVYKNGGDSARSMGDQHSSAMQHAVVLSNGSSWPVQSSPWIVDASGATTNGGESATALRGQESIILQQLREQGGDGAVWEIPPEEIKIDVHGDGSRVKLGRGGFGEVYRGVWNDTIPVAVKFVLTSDTNNANTDNYKQLAKEIAILRECRNSNIVQFYGACLRAPAPPGEPAPHALMLVTEYMPLGDLFAALQGPRGAEYRWQHKGRFIALDIARGLSYLHSRRIAHFDLKSPNVLLSSNCTAKIADMGMSRTLAKDVVTKSTSIGTLAWAAPELLINTRISSAVDIYSMGVILWEIATGLVPMRGRMRSLRPGVDCPQALVSLYLDCTALEAERRPTASQLYSRLHAIVFEDGQAPDEGVQGSARDHAAVAGAPVVAELTEATPASGLTEAAPVSLATTAFFADDDSDIE